MRLARVGIENAVAYLEDGVSGWVKGGYELEYMPQVSAGELAELLEKEKDHVAVLDVREATEVQGGAIENSIRIPLGQLSSRIADLDREKLLVVHCKGGYRSSIATSILRRAGFREVVNLTGGFDAWTSLRNKPSTENEMAACEALVTQPQIEGLLRPIDRKREQLLHQS